MYRKAFGTKQELIYEEHAEMILKNEQFLTGKKHTNFLEIFQIPTANLLYFLFRELLVETSIKLDSTWNEIRPLIRHDLRFLKYSIHDRKCEAEFESY